MAWLNTFREWLTDQFLSLSTDQFYFIMGLILSSCITWVVLGHYGIALIEATAVILVTALIKRPPL